jgi:diaminopimelate epimerase
MRIRFTKMQGAGNDFVVLDETRQRLGLSPAQYRQLADRHFGVGADQILSVRPAPAPGIDFEYVIHNADGGEVEQCGNGARCFARFVVDKGLAAGRRSIRVKTLSGVIEPRLNDDGRVTVDMGAPVFDPPAVPFDNAGLSPHPFGNWHQWHIALGTHAEHALVHIAVLSMGNPHAVQLVENVDEAPVAKVGPLVELHNRFPNRVNAGFMQVVDRGRIRLRVW